MRLAWLAPILLLGCGGSDEVIPDDDPTPIDAEPVFDSILVDPDAGDACGGLAGLTCPETHFCDYPENTCGGSDELGTCVPRPELCKPLEDPVCGCDGTVYATDCAANLAGADQSDLGGCAAPADTFACGPRFCALADEYCRVSLSDVAGTPHAYTCVALPGPCGATPDCACLLDEPCGDQCAGDDAVGLTVTCPGG